jgi:hypothetical protein
MYGLVMRSSVAGGPFGPSLPMCSQCIYFAHKSGSQVKASTGPVFDYDDICTKLNLSKSTARSNVYIRKGRGRGKTKGRYPLCSKRTGGVKKALGRGEQTWEEGAKSGPLTVDDRTEGVTYCMVAPVNPRNTRARANHCAQIRCMFHALM